MSLAKAPVSQFVTTWSRGYSYPAETLYTSNIGRPLNRRRLEQLFEWKNGGKLSKGKQESVERNYLTRYAELSRLPAHVAARDLLQQFGGGPIWRVFFLHCWRPQSFPIYDQHVHRAMEYVETGVPREIATSTQSVLADYTERYIPFWNRIQPGADRDADKALWVFGRLLKRYSWLLGPMGGGQPRAT